MSPRPLLPLVVAHSFAHSLCSFLTQQYYAVFSEDPEVPFLHRIGFFAAEDSARAASAAQYPVLPVRTLKRRLEMFLQVFAAVTSPKQLYKHQLL